MKSTTLRLATLFLLALGIHGCASTGATITSSVESIRDPEIVGGNTYFLKHSLFGLGQGINELEYKEYGRYLDTILADRGYKKVESEDEADQTIMFTCNLGPPRTSNYAYSVPTYGQTGVSSSRTTGNVSVRNGVGTYSGTTTYTPTYGITDSKTYSGTSTTYSRFILLTAYDRNRMIREKKFNSAPIWTTSVYSVGSSGDLRYVMPFMVLAMKPYVATNTGRRIEVKTSSDDKGVEALRGIVLGTGTSTSTGAATGAPAAQPITPRP